MSKGKKNKSDIAPVQAKAIAFSVQGPLPSAAEMRGYAEINPELPLRIMAMAEKQSGHRQTLEKKAVEAQIRSQRLGQFFAFFLGLGGIVSATITSIYGPWYSGLPQFATAFGVLIWAFIRGTKSNREERERKWFEARR